MVETAAILHQAGPRSLVILDEIGRGTATYDGLSIAWAVLEHLRVVNRSRSLFATHYHELTDLAGRLDGVRNATVRVREWGRRTGVPSRGRRRRRRPVLRRASGASRRPSAFRRRPGGRHPCAAGGFPRRPGTGRRYRRTAPIRPRAAAGAGAGAFGGRRPARTPPGGRPGLANPPGGDRSSLRNSGAASRRTAAAGASVRRGLQAPDRPAGDRPAGEQLDLRLFREHLLDPAPHLFGLFGVAAASLPYELAHVAGAPGHRDSAAPEHEAELALAQGVEAGFTRTLSQTNATVAQRKPHALPSSIAWSRCGLVAQRNSRLASSAIAETESPFSASRVTVG